MTPLTPAPVLIVGGGLTGLSAALHLTHPFLLVERESALGGLARTKERDGYYFDYTGHWLHLRDPALREMLCELMGGDLVLVRRVAQVFSQGTLTPYPFQANLFGLPPHTVYECLLAFIRSRTSRGSEAPRNFEQYILHHFGEGIARHFMIPYNSKLWGVHPREITSAWCSRFVPIPTLEQVVAGAVGAELPELGYNISFFYPRTGGIEALVRALATRIDPARVRLGAELEHVDPLSRTAVVNGERITYEALISSIPLPELVGRLAGAPREVVEAAQLLRATSVRYLNVATRSPAPERYHWIYVPEERLPFYRVGVYSNAIPSMAPPGGASLYVELASRDRSRTREELLSEVVPALVQARALRSADDLLFAELHEIEYAYVVFDENYERALSVIRPYLEQHRIYSRGRYGSWVYSAMEDSLLAGREVAGTVQQNLPKAQPQLAPSALSAQDMD